ncbi:PilZ domain-containing protein [Gynuella sunshinyii]|uniref:PilZ domain-containing protein n=1 Tax=Gynuella sunshinyii YC6258 TaxID=1445510 RepID=A0A0C5V900_9GAMM|nr:PilZ domain-containing protein [Gynuella sunshinyii]AJQ95840.1 hypothetical Protein YC6258_03804 [Gynuella sunshinyii YC6258]
MEERREFFRIDDMAFVCGRRWNEQQLSIPEYFPEFKFLQLHGELRLLEQDALTTYQKIDDEHVKHLLDIQNRKIDVLSKYLLIKDLAQTGIEPQKIVISEGGIGFRGDMQFAAQETIAVAIIFTPSYLSLFAEATVVACNPSLDGGFYVHAEFFKIPESDRQRLARHLLAEQARQRNSR